jgi:DNA-binding MarR family transcriptional regulator
MAAVKQAYRESFSLIERLHRQFLDVLRAELDRMGIDDINNVQSLILFNIGKDELTVGELTARGYYLGTNVTYNLKKLVEHGYVDQVRSPRDRRSVRVNLSAKGLDLVGKLHAVFEKHSAALEKNTISAEELKKINESLKKLERFWSNTHAFGAPATEKAA